MFTIVTQFQGIIEIERKDMQNTCLFKKVKG